MLTKNELKVLVYELEYDGLAMRSITLERVPGIDCEHWAIRDGGFALGKTAIKGRFHFILERLPSSRDAEYYREYRWLSAEAALTFWTTNRRWILATIAEKRAWYMREEAECLQNRKLTA